MITTHPHAGVYILQIMERIESEFSVHLPGPDCLTALCGAVEWPSGRSSIFPSMVLVSSYYESP
jgi:hypothetical protein